MREECRVVAWGESFSLCLHLSSLPIISLSTHRQPSTFFLLTTCLATPPLPFVYSFVLPFSRSPNIDQITQNYPLTHPSSQQTNPRKTPSHSSRRSGGGGGGTVSPGPTRHPTEEADDVDIVGTPPPPTPYVAAALCAPKEGKGTASSWEEAPVDGVDKGDCVAACVIEQRALPVGE